jgi:hypothetical protein
VKNFTLFVSSQKVHDDLPSRSFTGLNLLDVDAQAVVTFQTLRKSLTMNKKLDDAIIAAIVHTIDRVTAFYVDANAAKMVWPNEYLELLALNKRIRLFWNSREISDTLLYKRNLLSNAWDLLQCNFCYDRPGGISVNDHLEFQFNRQLPDFLNRFRNQYQTLAFPALNRLRAADLLRPSNLDISSRVAGRLFSREVKVSSSSSSTNPEIVDQEITDSIHQLLHTYPIFLNPAARYFFVDSKDVGFKTADMALAFGATYDINAEDFISMLDDYKFHFLLARAYFAPNDDAARSKSQWQIMDQLAKAFVGKDIRRNKFISQQNSVAGSLCALYVWELIYDRGMSEQDAIKKSAEAFNGSGEPSQTKKVRDRYKVVKEFIFARAKKYSPNFIVS